jgi:hypothetical protein
LRQTFYLESDKSRCFSHRDELDGAVQLLNLQLRSIGRVSAALYSARVKGRQYSAFTVYIDASIAEIEYETMMKPTLDLDSEKFRCFNHMIGSNSIAQYSFRSTASEFQIGRSFYSRDLIRIKPRKRVKRYLSDQGK